MKSYQKKILGFTFVELLVSLSIIAIIGALAPTFYKNAIQATKDTKRKNDLKQYSTALESYATDHESIYPLEINTIRVSTILCPTLTGYITNCLEDEKYSADTSYVYNYQSSADQTKWVIWAKMENGTVYWVYCSNRSSGQINISGTTISGGLCPL